MDRPVHYQFFQCVSLPELFDLGHNGHSGKLRREQSLNRLLHLPINKIENLNIVLTSLANHAPARRRSRSSCATCDGSFHCIVRPRPRPSIRKTLIRNYLGLLFMAEYILASTWSPIPHRDINLDFHAGLPLRQHGRVVLQDPGDHRNLLHLIPSSHSSYSYGLLSIRHFHQLLDDIDLPVVWNPLLLLHRPNQSIRSGRTNTDNPRPFLLAIRH